MGWGCMQLAADLSTTKQHALLSILVPHHLQVFCILIMVQLAIIDPHNICEAPKDGVDHWCFAPLEPAVRARARLGRVPEVRVGRRVRVARR